MSDEATVKSSKTWLYVVSTFASFVFVHVASIGPAIVFYQAGILSSNSYRATYEPLIWVSEKTFTTGLLGFYANVWCLAVGVPTVK